MYLTQQTAAAAVKMQNQKETLSLLLTFNVKQILGFISVVFLCFCFILLSDKRKIITHDNFM